MVLINEAIVRIRCAKTEDEAHDIFLTKRRELRAAGMSVPVALLDAHLARTRADGRRVCRERGAHRFHEFYSDAGCGDCGAREGYSDV